MRELSAVLVVRVAKSSLSHCSLYVLPNDLGVLHQWWKRKLYLSLKEKNKSRSPTHSIRY